MGKSKKKNGSGINFNADQIKIGGDVVGGNKIIHQAGSHIDLDEAIKLINEIKNRIDGINGLEGNQKVKLDEMIGEIKEEVNGEAPNPETILDKLKSFQNTLNTINGIGVAGLGLFTLVDSLSKLFLR